MHDLVYPSRRALTRGCRPYRDCHSGKGFLRLVPPEAGSAKARLHSSLAIEGKPSVSRTSPRRGASSLMRLPLGEKDHVNLTREPWVPTSLRFTMA